MTEPTEIVYLGRRMGTDGKIHHALITHDLLEKHNGLSSDRVEVRASWFQLKRTPASIGGIYLAPATLDANGKVIEVVSGQMEYKRTETHPHEAVWRALDRTADMAKRRKSMEARAAKDSALERMVEPLRYTYKRLAPSDRLAFQVWLINQLTK